MSNLYVKAHQKMMQRPIVAYLSLKGISAREIHDDIIINHAGFHEHTQKELPVQYPT
jgi:hypothetical protein